MNKKLTRRDILKLAGVTSTSLALSSCGIESIETPEATGTSTMTATATVTPTKTAMPTVTPRPTDTKVPRSELEILRNIADFLNGEADLETEYNIPQPTSGTTLRLYFLDKVKEMEDAGTIQPNELVLVEPPA